MLAGWIARLVIAALGCFLSPAWAQQNVPLGTAAAFGVLGQSTVTNTGLTIVTGSVGVWSGTSITGFGPGVIVPASGTFHAGDAVAQQAQTDLAIAYDNAANRACMTSIPSGTLGGLVLPPGVYCMGTADVTGTLTLSGSGVYVFQMSTTLTTAANSSIALTNGATACGVWWQVGSSATLGANSTIAGNILAFTSITATGGAAVDGRTLALGAAVTLDTNRVTACDVLAATTLDTLASPSVQVGGVISDTAMLGGGFDPTGSITFDLYGPGDLNCTGAPVFTSTVTVAGNGNYPSGNHTPLTAGTYRWIANYSGDTSNAATANACNESNESVVVLQAGTTLVTQASASVPVGGLISDTATLSGGVAPTGSIAFSLYGPDDATCVGAPSFTANVVVAGNGNYASGNFTTVSAGTYRWVANYSGDANNSATASICNAANESVVVSQAGTTLVTQASAGVTVGGLVSDAATLSGGVSPTGTMAFNLYGPNDATCTTAPVFTASVPVAGNGNYSSGTFTPPMAGTYRWIANYSGDANNVATANACNAANESVLVSQAVSVLVTQSSTGVTIGGAVNDAATLSGGFAPTGSIAFNLFGPDDSTCTGSPVFSVSTPVAGNGNYSSGSFTPVTAGTYRWIANYSGDANNSATANPCNVVNESVVVAQATPALVTQASAGVAVGGLINDTASLNGGIAPTGTIAFSLYGPNDATCIGAPVFTSTLPVAGNGSYASGNFTTTLAGTYRWIANYSGDANNTATANVCNAANESVVVSQANIALVTQASPGVSVGGLINDAATLSGGIAPTGTIAFNLYGPNDATCIGPPIFAAIVGVAGNGNYSSGNFTTVSAGTYRWIANYSGDANNTATANACNAANESVVVVQATTALVTQASPGVNIGGPINDAATLSGGIAPTGNITFNLYGPGDIACTSAPVFTSTVPVAGNGGYSSGIFTPLASGTYRWIANYSGDANNAPTANGCNAPNESAIVGVAGAVLVSTASGGVPLGGSISDIATLSGGVNPTGTISFGLFGPNDATCSGAPVFISTVTVNGNGAYSSGNFTPLASGTYRWIANYSGDANNAPTANGCNAPNESVIVGNADVVLVSTASAGVPLGGSISDSATLSGGVNPTGTISFSLFGPDDATCSGAPVFISTVTVSGNGAYSSGNFTPLASGTYRWIANYSGDINNAATTNACNASNENVVVTALAVIESIPTASDAVLLLMVLLLAVSGLLAAAHGSRPDTFGLIGRPHRKARRIA